MKKTWFVLPLLAILIVGASFAGCVGQKSSPQAQTPTATPTTRPRPTPHVNPTPLPRKALVGFTIGFKVINASYSKDGGKTWIFPHQGAPVLLMVQPYLIFPNGTKELMIKPWKNLWGVDCFYVIGFNRTQGWRGVHYYNYTLPFWGEATFYFSTVWNKTTYYHEMRAMLSEIQLKIGLANPSLGNYMKFTQAIENSTLRIPPPIIVINWTPGQSFKKIFVYKWTVNVKGSEFYGYKAKVYLEIWIKPVYVPWGQYPSTSQYPWQEKGNNYLPKP